MVKWEYLVGNIDRHGKPVAILVDNQNNAICKVFEGYSGYMVQSKIEHLKPIHITYDKCIKHEIENDRFETREEYLLSRLKLACKIIKEKYSISLNN